LSHRDDIRATQQNDFHVLLDVWERIASNYDYLVSGWRRRKWKMGVSMHLDGQKASTRSRIQLCSKCVFLTNSCLGFLSFHS
jgi:hypothetical protein